MERYIALLRGINISGKNKVSMPELKLQFEKMGCQKVITYINSGNVIFNTDIKDKLELIDSIHSMIKQIFSLDIPVTVVSICELEDIILNAPDWWLSADKEIYNNTIFMIPPTTTYEVHKIVGEPKLAYEQVMDYNDVIYWSANLKNFNKTRWSKIASLSVNDKVTIRNANTVKKLLELAKNK